MPTKKRKRYEARVYLGRDESGAQVFWYGGRYATKHERDDVVARARTERPWEREPADETTCDQWVDRLLARMRSGALRTKQGRRFKDSSIENIGGALKAFRAEFGSRTPASITRVEAKDWAATVPPSKLPSVIFLMNDLYGDEVITRNRFEGLSQRSPGRANDRPPSEEEMVLLLEACSALGEAYAPMMRALFTFGAYTLMRPSELYALEWVDIDLDVGAHGRANISKRLFRGTTDLPKSNKERMIAITPPAREALDSLLALRGYYPAGLVFRNKSGKQLRQPTLTGYWKEVRARARLDHDFYLATKHYGVWYMKVRLNLPDAVIAAQAGWSESTVTKMVATYSHSVDERRLAELDIAFESDADRDAIPA